MCNESNESILMWSNNSNNIMCVCENNENDNEIMIILCNIKY